MNKGLAYLYQQFDRLSRQISKFCRGCTDHDCEGYVYLLAREAVALYNKGVPIVELNSNTRFIHSFLERGGRLALDQPKPPCRLRCGGRCTYYRNRPLVCRMYPVGLAMRGGEVVLALHPDCRFSRSLSVTGKERFFEKVRGIFTGAPKSTLRILHDTYAAVDAISAFPNGQNLIDVICPFADLLRRR